jgi:hypothetical protein
MAERFVSVIMPDGTIGTHCDFISLAAAEDQIECDLTLNTTQLFSGVASGIIANGAVVTLQSSLGVDNIPGVTATVLRCGYQGTSMLLTGISSATVAISGDLWCVTANTATRFALSGAWATGTVAIARFECGCSAGSADVTNVVFDSASWGTNATAFIEVAPFTGHHASHVWDAAKYRLSPPSTGSPITFQEEFVSVHGLQIMPSNRHGFSIVCSASICVQAIDSCYVFQTGTIANQYSGVYINNGTAQAARSLYIVNNIFRNFRQSPSSANGVAVYFVGNQSSKAFVGNNTIIDCERGIIVNGTVSVVNNIFSGITTTASIMIGTFAANINNCSDCGSAAYSQMAVGSVADSGTTDGVTEGKLVDSDQNFASTVSVGMVVANTTHSTYARVTNVDSNATLSLSESIMDTGENYTIYTNRVGPITFQDRAGGSFALSAADTTALNFGFDNSAWGFNTDINGTARPQQSVWDIGAYELAGAAGINGGGFNRFFAVKQVSQNLSCPADLYSDSENAQFGETNPALVGLVPRFSALAYAFVGNPFTEYKIQVSGPNDPTFTATTMNWDPGFASFAASVSGVARCENIIYGA